MPNFSAEESIKLEFQVEFLQIQVPSCMFPSLLYHCFLPPPCNPACSKQHAPLVNSIPSRPIEQLAQSGWPSPR